LVAPESAQRQTWERSDAIRELLRGRLEVSGPVTAESLVNTLDIARSEIDAALLALEAEGFILRGRFRPGAPEQEWCDRRLLARIHRLTLDRLRAEIQPVSQHEFYRFLFAWQRVNAEHRAEGPEGLETVFELLDGCELPLAAWEPEVLSARVGGCDPQWLDRLCFSGRIGWGRLTARRIPKPARLRRSAAVPLHSINASILTTGCSWPNRRRRWTCLPTRAASWMPWRAGALFSSN
jgi:ATP-dependent Lhr-like helicase